MAGGSAFRGGGGGGGRNGSGNKGRKTRRTDQMTVSPENLESGSSARDAWNLNKTLATEERLAALVLAGGFLVCAVARKAERLEGWSE